MGFFKKSVPCESKRTALTIIAKGNKISGAMIVTGKLHIDGCVEGEITSVEHVSISQTGSVIGCIQAKNIIVSGLLQGDVFCEHLHIACGGRVKGKVESIELTMDSKSHFTGERREISRLPIERIDPLLHTNNAIYKERDFIEDLPSKITLGSLPDTTLDLAQKLQSEGEKTPSDLRSNKDLKPLSKTQTTIISTEKDPKKIAHARLNPIPSASQITAELAAHDSTSDISKAPQASADKLANASALSPGQQSKPKVINKKTTKVELEF